MRHLKSGNRLGVDSSHRKALIRNMVTSLLEKGRIKTTLAKAKALRSDAEKMVTLSKKGTLHSRRIALKTLRTKESMIRLFDGYSKLYKDRNGGYTRIYKIGNRLGDNAKMALIEMVDYANLDADLNITDQETVAKSDKDTKKSVLKEVNEDVAKTSDVNSVENAVPEKTENIVSEPADESDINKEPVVDSKPETESVLTDANEDVTETPEIQNVENNTVSEKTENVVSASADETELNKEPTVSNTKDESDLSDDKSTGKKAE